jgi:hypothetical protein
MQLAAKTRIHRPTVRRRTKALQARQALKRDLAGYSTPSERIELAAILERAEPEHAAQLREILDELPPASDPARGGFRSV